MAAMRGDFHVYLYGPRDSGKPVENYYASARRWRHGHSATWAPGMIFRCPLHSQIGVKSDFHELRLYRLFYYGKAAYWRTFVENVRVEQP